MKELIHRLSIHYTFPSTARTILQQRFVFCTRRTRRFAALLDKKLGEL